MSFLLATRDPRRSPVTGVRRNLSFRLYHIGQRAIAVRIRAGLTSGPLQGLCWPFRCSGRLLDLGGLCWLTRCDLGSAGSGGRGGRRGRDGVDLLRGDEVLLADQRWMSAGRGDHPLLCRVPAANVRPGRAGRLPHPAGRGRCVAGSTPAGRCSGGWRGSPRRCVASIGGRCGVGCGRGRRGTGRGFAAG